MKCFVLKVTPTTNIDLISLMNQTVISAQGLIPCSISAHVDYPWGLLILQVLRPCTKYNCVYSTFTEVKMEKDI